MKAKKEDDQRADPVSIMSQFDVWNIQRQYVYGIVLLDERERSSDLTKEGYLRAWIPLYNLYDIKK